MWNTTSLKQAYRMAMYYEKLFTDALIKQFGEKGAGNKRYQPSLFNDETAAASKESQNATSVYLDIMRACRENSTRKFF